MLCTRSKKTGEVNQLWTARNEVLRQLWRRANSGVLVIRNATSLRCWKESMGSSGCFVSSSRAACHGHIAVERAVEETDGGTVVCTVP